jgi:hypothetical protein
MRRESGRFAPAALATHGSPGHDEGANHWRLNVRAIAAWAGLVCAAVMAGESHRWSAFVKAANIKVD